MLKSLHVPPNEEYQPVNEIDKLRETVEQQTFKLKCSAKLLLEERKTVVNLKQEDSRKVESSLAVIRGLQEELVAKSEA